MKYISFHLLRSVPFNNINRDDAGEPKTGHFGGVLRGRVSSQCFVHWLRKAAKARPALAPHFGGLRTKMTSVLLKQALIERSMSEVDAAHLADVATNAIYGKFKTPGRTEILVFTSPTEINAFATTLFAEAVRLKDKIITETIEKPKGKSTKKGQKKDSENPEINTTSEDIVESNVGSVEENPEEPKITYTLHKEATSALTVTLKQLESDASAIDISLFGRMLTSCPELTKDATTSRNHWLTTHEVKLEDDYWTAVEESPGDKKGSAMIDTALFSSGVFYGYFSINLSQLREELRNQLNDTEFSNLIRDFTNCIVTTMPGAKRNSYHADTPIEYALAVIDEGQPYQLVNAFDHPINGKTGFINPSIEALERKLAAAVSRKFIQPQAIYKTGVADAEEMLPLDEFCELVGKASITNR